MAATGGGFANYNHDNVFTTANGLEPASKQPCAGETRAAAYLVWSNGELGQIVWPDSLASDCCQANLGSCVLRPQ